jgi:hypothetical protein
VAILWLKFEEAWIMAALRKNWPMTINTKPKNGMSGKFTTKMGGGGEEEKRRKDGTGISGD